ncbi:MAG: ATP-dependent sacrificial sulfur transferase LarE [Methanobacteriota archaeon]|nr:MAG: ATP-dependent sacrificial sulfur transferase LarE [Euryarchaeota archaeon]
MDERLQGKYDAIRAVAARRRRVLVAYSGGVDSGLVAKIVFDTIGDGALAILADSESLARWEVEAATAHAAEIGIPLRVVHTSELASEEYRLNPANRCYFCREGLADALVPIARRESFAAIADGINVSDLGDVRPGIRAMDEAGFWHPLVDAGLAKADVRSLARGLGLSFWDKPSNACLSSRVPHGTLITLEVLRQVEAAEEYLRGRGFRQVRVRHYGTTAKIEVPPEDILRLVGIRDDVAGAFRALGYRETVVDAAGYRSSA